LNSGSSPWATPPALFDMGIFRVSLTICTGWLQNMILLISASWIAKITGVSHQRPPKHFLFLFLIIHLFTCAYIVWVISPPCLTSLPFPPFPPHFQTEPVLPLSLILLKKRHKYNKEDKVFLLVELRIAIQKDS
jgi:hypothetical protein